MHGKLEANAAGIANPFADPLGEFEMMPVARREVRTALGNANDGLAACEFLLRQPEIEVALEVKGSHARIVRIVEPQLRAQAPSIPSHRRASIPNDCGIYIGRLDGCVLAIERVGNSRRQTKWRHLGNIGAGRTRSQRPCSAVSQNRNAKPTIRRTHCIALVRDRTVSAQTMRL